MSPREASRRLQALEGTREDHDYDPDLPLSGKILPLLKPTGTAEGDQAMAERLRALGYRGRITFLVLSKEVVEARQAGDRGIDRSGCITGSITDPAHIKPERNNEDF